MALTGDLFSTALKELYLGPLNDNIYRSKVMLDRMEKNSSDVSGRYAYISLISARNPGVGSRTDVSGSGPLLPEAGRQAYSAATFNMTYHYGRGSISGPVMRDSKNNAGAFAKALDTEMKGLSESLPEDLNRQIWSYGHGRAATLAGTTTTYSTGTTFFCAARSVFQLRVGDRVQLSPIATWDGKPNNGTTIAAITRDLLDTIHRVVLTAASGAAVTSALDAVYYGSNSAGMVAADSSKAQNMFGIPAAIDDGAVGADEALAAAATEFQDATLFFGAIDRTVAAGVFWRSQVLQDATPGTYRPLTVSLMEQAWLRAVTVGGATEQELEIYTTPSLWATFGLLHVGDRRYNDYKEKLAGGWQALDFNGSKMMYDRDAPRGNIWFIPMKNIFLLTQSGYELMDDDGSPLSRINGRDAYEFTLFRDMQLGANNCTKAAVLKDMDSSVIIEG